jgi:hypothetical protein
MSKNKKTRMNMSNKTPELQKSWKTDHPEWIEAQEKKTNLNKKIVHLCFLIFAGLTIGKYIVNYSRMLRPDYFFSLFTQVVFLIGLIAFSTTYFNPSEEVMKRQSRLSLLFPIIGIATILVTLLLSFSLGLLIYLMIPLAVMSILGLILGISSLISESKYIYSYSIGIFLCVLSIRVILNAFMG